MLCVPQLLLAFINVIKEASFVAKTLTNNIKPEEYTRIQNIDDLSAIFSLLKEDTITGFVLAQNAIKSLLEDAQFDYTAYFKANTTSATQIQDAIQKVIAENEAIAKDIKEGNQGKAGILVGKVIGIIGKGASGKVIREGILSNLSGEQTSNKEANNKQ